MKKNRRKKEKNKERKTHEDSVASVVMKRKKKNQKLSAKKHWTALRKNLFEFSNRSKQNVMSVMTMLNEEKKRKLWISQRIGTVTILPSVQTSNGSRSNET